MDGQKLLCRQPVLHDFSDSVAYEKSGFRPLDRRDKDGIKGVRSSVDRVARYLQACDHLPMAKTPQQPVAKSKATTDESHGDNEDEVLHVRDHETAFSIRSR